jgi:hypothetical protein
VRKVNIIQIITTDGVPLPARRLRARAYATNTPNFLRRLNWWARFPTGVIEDGFVMRESNSGVRYLAAMGRRM